MAWAASTTGPEAATGTITAGLEILTIAPTDAPAITTIAPDRVDSITAPANKAALIKAGNNPASPVNRAKVANQGSPAKAVANQGSPAKAVVNPGRAAVKAVASPLTISICREFVA